MKNATLVFGASLKPQRYANMAIRKLRDHNHEVLAFGLRSGQVGDVEILTDIESLDHVDTITMYLSPEHQVMYYDSIIDLKPKRVIFNPGTENPEFFKLLTEQNISYEIACTLVLLSTGQY